MRIPAFPHNSPATFHSIRGASVEVVAIAARAGGDVGHREILHANLLRAVDGVFQLHLFQIRIEVPGLRDERRLDVA